MISGRFTEEVSLTSLRLNLLRSDHRLLFKDTVRNTNVLRNTRHERKEKNIGSKYQIVAQALIFLRKAVSNQIRYQFKL